MKDPQFSKSVPSDESPAQKQARLRRERRDAKIKAGGSARLDKITQLSGRPAEASTCPLYCTSELLSQVHRIDSVPLIP